VFTSNLASFVTNVVVPESTFDTDGWYSREVIANCGFQHDVVVFEVILASVEEEDLLG
jgi:hypothetical protein